jgi:hypothetical protein
MRTRVLAVAALVLLPSLALAWGWGPPPPAATVTVDLDGTGRFLTLGPYTANDYSGDVYDPVNLFFLDTDPREIRQALLGLDGNRGMDGLPFGNCLWEDGMGSEQVAWAENEGWVGGGVQLVCVNPGEPLGDPFRVHLRLYRQGDVTMGAAHLDFLIPGTAQHEALSWDVPRNFVAVDMVRTGLLTALPQPVPVTVSGTFREILRPIYDALFYGGAVDLLIFLDLAEVPPYPPAPPPAGDVPIPSDGVALVFSANIILEQEWTVTRSKTVVDYDIVSAKPFCATGPADLVHLAGPVELGVVVYTSPWGAYKRYHWIRGKLSVTPVAPNGSGGYTPTGPPVPAVVSENHRAVLNDWYDQLSQEVSQTLLSDPRQSLRSKLLGGAYDRYDERESCGGDGHCDR